ncbi:uncharacterized protein PF11_0213-like [Trichogramma pretiosum]|uniref:uncharacterized protein PF11_0213-like n=1 Tax=Trichogramma pretiosum TaxID=7493 RepID=UPI0006C9733E|nr:uncharacterized protein PF11_0213-like [Trichogramma pretiosum]
MNRKHYTESHDSYGKKQKNQSKYLLEKKKHLCPFSSRVILERILLVDDNYLKDYDSVKLNFKDVNNSDNNSVPKSVKKNKQNNDKITNNKARKCLNVNKKNQGNKIDHAKINSSKLDKLPKVILQRLSMSKIISCSTKKDNFLAFKSIIGTKPRLKIENNETKNQITSKNNNEKSVMGSSAILSELKKKHISFNSESILDNKTSLTNIKADKICLKNASHSTSKFLENSEYQKEVNESKKKSLKVKGFTQPENLFRINKNVKKKHMKTVKSNLLESQKKAKELHKLDIKKPLKDKLNFQPGAEQVIQHIQQQSLNICKKILQTKVVLERLPKNKYIKNNENNDAYIKDILNNNNSVITDPVSEKATESFRSISLLEKKNSIEYDEINAITSGNNVNQKKETTIKNPEKILSHNLKHRTRVHQKVEKSVKEDNKNKIRTNCTSKKVLQTNGRKRTTGLETNLKNISKNYPLVVIKPISKDIFATKNPILNFKDQLPDNKLVSGRNGKISDKIYESRKKLDAEAASKTLSVESKLSSTKDIILSEPEKIEVLSDPHVFDQLPSCCDMNLYSTPCISSQNQKTLPSSFKIDKQLMVCVKRLKDYSINSKDHTQNSYKSNSNKNYVVKNKNKKNRNFNKCSSSAVENETLFFGDKDTDLNNVNSKDIYIQQISNEKSTFNSTCLNSISSQKLYTASPKGTKSNENIKRNQKVYESAFKLHNSQNNEYIEKQSLNFPLTFEKVEPLMNIKEECNGLSDEHVKSLPLKFINASYCASKDKPKEECRTIQENIKNFGNLVTDSKSKPQSINESKKNLDQECPENVMSTIKIHENDDISDESSFIKALDAASVRKVIRRFKTYNSKQMPLIKELVPLLVKIKTKKNKNFQIKKRVSMKAAVIEQNYNKNRCLAKKVIAKKRNLLKLESTKNTNIDTEISLGEKEEIQKTKDEKLIRKNCRTNSVQNFVELVSVNEKPLKPNEKRTLVKSIITLDKPYDLNLFRRRSPRKLSCCKNLGEKTTLVKKNLTNLLMPETPQKFINTKLNMEKFTEEKSSSLIFQNKSDMLVKILEDWDDQCNFKSLRTDNELFRIDHMTISEELKACSDVLVTTITNENESEKDGKRLSKANSTKKCVEKKELIFNENSNKVDDLNIHSIDKKTLKTTNFDIAQNIAVSSSVIKEKILTQELLNFQNDQVSSPFGKHTYNHDVKLDDIYKKHVLNESISKDVDCEFIFEKKTESTSTYDVDDSCQNKTYSFDKNLVMNEHQNFKSKEMELESYESEKKPIKNVQDKNLEILKTEEMKICEDQIENENVESASTELRSDLSNINFTSKSISPTKIRITARKNCCNESPEPIKVNVKDIAKIIPKGPLPDGKCNLHKKLCDNYELLTSEKVDRDGLLNLESTESDKNFNSTIEEKPMSEFEKFTEALQIRPKPIEQKKQVPLSTIKELGHLDVTSIKLESKNYSFQNYHEKSNVDHVDPFCQLKMLSEAIAILSKNKEKPIEQSSDSPIIKNYYNSKFIGESKNLNELKLLKKSLKNKQSNKHQNSFYKNDELLNENSDTKSTVSNVSISDEQNVQNSSTESEFSNENTQNVKNHHSKVVRYSKFSKNQKLVSHMTKTSKQNEVYRDNIQNTMPHLEKNNSLTEPNEVTEEVIIYNEGMNIGTFDLLDHTYSRRRDDDSEESIEDDSRIDSKSEEDFPETNNCWNKVSLQELKSNVSSSNNKSSHNHLIKKSNCTKNLLPMHNHFHNRFEDSKIHPYEIKKEDVHLHRNEPVKCKKCDRTYMDKNRLKKHYYECGIPPIYHCPLCFYTARYKPSVIRHLKNDHPDKIIETNFEEILDKVQKKATEIKTKFKNQILAEETSKKIQSDHSNPLIRVPRSLKIYCPNCKEEFTKIPSNYKKFCNTCNINLMFNCHQCERRYILTNRISCHIQGKCRVGDQDDEIVNKKSHVRKTFPKVKFIESEICSKGCGKKFKLHSTRLKHQKLCGKARDLTCNICSFKTKYQSTLKFHTKLHVLNQDRNITSKIAEDEHSNRE